MISAKEIESSPLVPPKAIRYGFYIGDSFYFGPEDGDYKNRENSFDPTKIEERSIKLPELEYTFAVERYVWASEVLKHPETILNHYRRILELCKEYQKNPWKKRHLFSGAAILQNGEYYNSFAGGVDDLEDFVSRIYTIKSGEIKSDVDQGYTFDIIARDGFIVVQFGEGELDEVMEMNTFKFRQADLIPHLQDELECARKVHNLIDKELQMDTRSMDDLLLSTYPKLKKSWFRRLIDRISGKFDPIDMYAKVISEQQEKPFKDK